MRLFLLANIAIFLLLQNPLAAGNRDGGPARKPKSGKRDRFQRDALVAEHGVTSSRHGRGLSPGSVKLRVASWLLRPERLEWRFRRYDRNDVRRFLGQLAEAVDEQLAGRAPGQRTELSDRKLREFRASAADFNTSLLLVESMPRLESMTTGQPEEALGLWGPIDYLRDLATPGSPDARELEQMAGAHGFPLVYVFTGQPTVFQRDLALARMGLIRAYNRRDSRLRAGFSYHQVASHLAPRALQQVLEGPFEDRDLSRYGLDEIVSALQETVRSFALTWFSSQ